MSSFLKNPTVLVVAHYFPKMTTIILAVVCFALGMVWAYGISPTSFVDGSPAQLDQSFQDQWVLGAAGRFASRSAATELNIQALLELVDNPTEIVTRLQQLPTTDPNFTPDIAFLQDPEFQQLANQAEANAQRAPSRPGLINNIVMPIVTLVVFVILFVLGKVLWTLLIFPFIEPVIAKGRDKSDSHEQIEAIKARRAYEDDMKAAVVDTTKYGEPVIRRASMFQSGFGNYDDSFNIETDAGMYYGEAGATISETVGEGGATAIEIWMFDKDEFANTPTAIFASSYAFNDPAIKSRLEPKGEVSEMVPGAKIILETAALYVEATCKSVNYKADAEIPNSVIDSSTIEVIAWSKAGAPGGGSGGTTSAASFPPPMPDTTQMAPPPTPLSPPPMGGGFPPAPQQQQQVPLSPPPLGNPQPLQPPPMGGGFPPAPYAPPSPFGDEPEVDDPFGGTGDFTPVNPNK